MNQFELDLLANKIAGALEEDPRALSNEARKRLCNAVFGRLASGDKPNPKLEIRAAEDLMLAQHDRAVRMAAVSDYMYELHARTIRMDNFSEYEKPSEILRGTTARAFEESRAAVVAWTKLVRASEQGEKP